MGALASARGVSEGSRLVKSSSHTAVASDAKDKHSSTPREPEPLQQFNISFFILRTNKITTSPLPTTKLKYEAKETRKDSIVEAEYNAKACLMGVIQKAFVHSERDLLWTKLIHEASPYEPVRRTLINLNTLWACLTYLCFHSRSSMNFSRQ